MLRLMKTSQSLCSAHLLLNLTKLRIHAHTHTNNAKSTSINSHQLQHIFHRLTSSATYSHGGAHLCQELRARIQGTQSSNNAPSDSHHTQSITQTGCFLVGKASQGTDTEQARAQVHHLMRERDRTEKMGLWTRTEGPQDEK